jgi:cytochrome c
MREYGLAAGAILLAFTCVAGQSEGHPAAASPRLGRPVPSDVIRAWDITVSADGSGLPQGTGSVAEGHELYEAKCRACHGAAGAGGIADRLTGGVGSLASNKPIKTVASYWPYAPTLFDYVRRAMPLTAPQSLSDQDVYSLVAYLLSIDGIVAGDARLDGPSVARIRMPNRDGFVSLERTHFDGNVERVTAGKTTGE